MFWSIYVLSVFFCCHFLASFYRKYYFAIFILTTIFFLTPSQVDISDSSLTPSVYAYLFNILFERDYSIRVLRPLLLTIPSGFFLILIIYFVKKRF